MNYATFRFVPIEPDRIVTPPVPLDEICFDRPLAKGSVSGTIEVTWTAKTPICIGGEGEGKEDSPVRALKIGDRHCLPGSTLRGMVRAVLEAATFSHLGRINSAHHHGVRDFVGYGEHHRYRPDDVKAGWLRYERGHWIIHPAKRTRREEREVDLLLTPFGSIFKRIGAEASTIDTWQLHKEVWDKLAALPDGLRMRPMRPFWPLQEAGRAFPGPPKVLMHRPTDPAQQSRYYSNAEHVLVVTGPAMQAGDEKTTKGDDKRLKESEALFPMPDERTESEIAIPKHFMEVFHRQHSDPGREGGDPRDAWRFWLRAYGWERKIGQFKNNREEPAIPPGTANPALGIPVFWKGDPATATEDAEPGGQGFWFGLSRVIRVPYRYSVGEVAAHLYKSHPTRGYRQPRLDEEGGWDFARAMFGEVDAANTDPNTTEKRRRPDSSQREDALKGRVAFGFAWAAPGATETPATGGVFSQPRESFWPFYLAPREGTVDETTHPVDYGHADAVPAGRKRTLVRRTAVPATGWPRGNENRETFTYLRFLNAGTRFTGQVRFHNLHPVELGALLWALGFGRTDGSLWHQAGRAKGFGYGALSPSFRFVRGPLIRNLAQPPAKPADPLAWIELFRSYMTKELREPFEKHDSVAPFIAFADPATGAAEAVKLTVSTLDEYRHHRDAARAGQFGPDMTRNRLPDPA